MILYIIISKDYARKQRMVSGDNEDINVAHNSVESEGEVTLPSSIELLITLSSSNVSTERQILLAKPSYFLGLLVHCWQI